MQTIPQWLRALLVLIVSLPALSVSLLPTTSAQQGERRGLNLPTQPAGHFYALVIGNNYYTALPKLKTAEADARALEHLLKVSYGFQTKLLLNATRAQIVSALSTYRRELTADANLLIYYAGHGYNDKEADKAYWLPVDASRDDTTNWIIADEITTDIRVIPAKHVLVISDSCYSGTLLRTIGATLPRPNEHEQYVQKMAAGHSRTLIASGGDEPVADSGGGSNHSVFASALLRGLRETDKGQFTAAELYHNYVLEAVAGQAQQTPVYALLQNSGHKSGDFVFVRVPAGAKTLGLPSKALSSAPVDPAVFELAYWDAIKDSSDPDAYRDYLAKYPNGQFVDIARRRAAQPPPTATSQPTGVAKLSYAELIDKAYTEIDAHDFNTAAQLLNQAINLDAAQPMAYQLLGPIRLYAQKDFSSAEQAMRAAIEHGGAAVFHVYHDHASGEFSQYCEGSLSITKSGLSFSANNGQDSFTTDDVNLKEVKANGVIGVNLGAFHLAFKTKVNGRVNFNFAPGSGNKAETQLLINLIRSY